jgi:8-amino-7-oxononanoate synthase
VTGNHPLHAELETRLAALKETQAACVFGSGYLANLGIVPALVGKNDLILIDELAHACLFAGARLSGAHVEIFRHNDAAHAEMLLAARRRKHAHAMLLTDGVFSMDGDVAPLALLGEICAQHDAWLMSDDAHGLGVLAQGRGSSFVLGTKAQVPLQMGTLSKALGSYGGYLCASKPIVDLIKTRARTLIYSTGLPPSALAAALAALGVIAAEPGLCELPLAKARLFCRRLGLPEPQSQIVPLIIGDADATLAASKRLEDAGFLVVAIRPPSVPSGTARLRLAFTVAHEDADIIRLADLIAGDPAFRSFEHQTLCLQSS